MDRRRVLAFASLVLALGALGCTTRSYIPVPDASRDAPGAFDGGVDSGPHDAGPRPDRGPLDPDAACENASATATVERQPVDIIWVVDNSTSMAPAIREVQDGLDDFAALLAGAELDYRFILLSLRGTGIEQVEGSNRYALCVPPPVGGANCADNPPTFYQVDLDVRSEQPIEQFLGTLAQTSGYTVPPPDDRGSLPWRQLLREGTAKTIVVVTDDNSRTCALPGTAPGCQAADPELTATSLEDFPGGGNPFSSRTLGPGILTAEYGTLFTGYTFNGIYGWGSDTDPTVDCDPLNTNWPESSGPTYTALVTRTGGVRAKICDGHDAWAPFLDALANRVVTRSEIECSITMPPPPDGFVFLPDRINVWVDTGAGPARIGATVDLAGCDPTRGGWYYDNPTAPTSVELCPATCDAVQNSTNGAQVDVQFGCLTIPI